jgi:hypothetical protein
MMLGVATLIASSAVLSGSTVLVSGDDANVGVQSSQLAHELRLRLPGFLITTNHEDAALLSSYEVQLTAGMDASTGDTHVRLSDAHGLTLLERDLGASELAARQARELAAMVASAILFDQRQLVPFLESESADREAVLALKLGVGASLTPTAGVVSGALEAGVELFPGARVRAGLSLAGDRSLQASRQSVDIDFWRLVVAATVRASLDTAIGEVVAGIGPSLGVVHLAGQADAGGRRTHTSVHPGMRGQLELQWRIGSQRLGLALAADYFPRPPRYFWGTPELIDHGPWRCALLLSWGYRI